MTGFPEAQRAIDAGCAALEIVTVPLAQSLGLVAAQTIVAREDLIPFARSAMDGYAVHTGDLATLPVTLPLAGAVYAASASTEQRHERGTATAIATGAALPRGADAVVPFEDVALAPGAIVVSTAVAPDDAIFPPGDDARVGDVLVARGTSITPAILGILAAAGEMHVAVHRRPLVTIICGGDELVAIDARPGHGQIRNSNASVVASTLEVFGATVRAVVTIGDDRAVVKAALADALADSDLVVTTGGASVGERDYVKAVARELGVVFAFETVALRPAKPSAFGRMERAALVVLPGNPAAAFVGLHEFVRPAVRALLGHTDVLLPRITAELVGTIHAKPGRHFAAFAALEATPTGLRARPLENQCSSLTRAVAESCGFIIVPPGEGEYLLGDQIMFDVVDWSKIRTSSIAENLYLT